MGFCGPGLETVDGLRFFRSGVVSDLGGFGSLEFILTDSDEVRWILAAVVAWFLLRCRLTAEGLFLDDVAREQEYRLRFVAWFLQGGGVLPRRKDFQPRRPWLLRRSQPLFRQRTCAAILAESVLKPLLRLGKRLRVYLRDGQAFSSSEFSGYQDR